MEQKANALPYRPLRRHPWTIAGLLAIAFATASPSLRATDLSRDAERVQNAWIGASVAVTRMTPRFLASGEALPLSIAVPPALPESKCTTVGVLGTRTMDFTVEVRPSPDGLAKEAPREPERRGRQSVAGSAMLSRCGPSRSELQHLLVRMKSPQGAVEVLVAHGSRPAPSLDSLLPERASGTTLRTGRPGPPPGVAPIADRLAMATQRIREQGGGVAERTELRTDGRGRVARRMRLDPGCHRLIAAPVLRAGRQRRVSDTDMEMRDPASDNVLVRDRGFSTDAVVERCVGAPAVVDVAIGGVPPPGRVMLMHGQWPISRGIPGTWDPDARAEIAHALLHRRGPELREDPVWQGFGVAGTTVIPVPVEPGACYVFAAGAGDGEAKAVQVAARVGPRLAADNGGGGMAAAVVSFCSGSERVARLEVSAFGSRVAWVAGAWLVARTPTGVEVLP